MISELFLACALAVPSVVSIRPIADEQTCYLSSLLSTTYGKEDRDKSRVLFYGNVPTWIVVARRSLDRVCAMMPIQRGEIDIVGVPTGIPITARAINVIVYLSSIPADRWKTMKYASEINRILRDKGLIVFYERVAPGLKPVLEHMGYSEIKGQGFFNFTVMRKKHRGFENKISVAA